MAAVLGRSRKSVVKAQPFGNPNHKIMCQACGLEVAVVRNKAEENSGQGTWYVLCARQVVDQAGLYSLLKAGTRTRLQSISPL